MGIVAVPKFQNQNGWPLTTTSRRPNGLSWDINSYAQVQRHGSKSIYYTKRRTARENPPQLVDYTERLALLLWSQLTLRSAYHLKCHSNLTEVFDVFIGHEHNECIDCSRRPLPCDIMFATLHYSRGSCVPHMGSKL
jgi:hypothetical protein